MNIHCGDVKRFERRLQLNERKLLPRTNFASYALMDKNRSAIVPIPGNAPKMAVEIRTTLSYMVQKGFSLGNLNPGKGATVKQLHVA